MNTPSPLANLVIRTAAVGQPDRGYIIACDLKKEKEDIPHAIIFRWHAGKFNKGDRNYDAHTACIIEKPEPGLLDASGQGYYSVNTRAGMTSGDIFENSQPPPRQRRTASFRSVATIDGKAYAVGLRGLVYRLDGITKWTRIDDGLPPTFNIQAIHGFGASDIYAVGRHGSLWHFDGKAWQELELPTNVNLTSVKCAGDGKVYIGGHKGVLILGRGEAWAIVDHGDTSDDIWDVEWFEGRIFVSTMRAVYRLKGEKLEPVDFGDDPPKSCYQLCCAKGVMWSNGEFDIMAFDGKNWSRIV